MEDVEEIGQGWYEEGREEGGRRGVTRRSVTYLRRAGGTRAFARVNRLPFCSVEHPRLLFDAHGPGGPVEWARTRGTCERRCVT